MIFQNHSEGTTSNFVVYVTGQNFVLVKFFLYFLCLVALIIQESGLVDKGN